MDTYGYMDTYNFAIWMIYVLEHVLDLDGRSIWMIYIYILRFLDVFRDILPYIYIYLTSDDQISRFPTLGISSVFKMDRS